MKTVIAIDIGGTLIKSALVSSDGKILKSKKTPTQASESRDIITSNLREAFDKVYESSAIAVGIGSPGCVDPKTGIVDAVDNIPALSGLCLTDFLKGHKEIPVMIDNDANNAAKGEYLFGIGKGTKNFMGITLGTGVGGGLFLDGRFYRGTNNYSGEIGHMTYIPDGLSCACGKNGCLEAYASGPAMVRSAKSMLKRNFNTKLSKHKVDAITPELICKLADQGDRLSMSIVHDVARALGIVLGTATNLMNLECIAVGGGISLAGDVLFQPLGIYAARHTLPRAYECCIIKPSEIGNDAGLLGCAATALMK